MVILRQKWESTSFALDKLQANPECVAQEEAGLTNRTSPPYETTLVPAKTLNKFISKIPILGDIVIPKEVGEGLDKH